MFTSTHTRTHTHSLIFMSKAWHHGCKPGLYNSKQEAALHQTKTVACVCIKSRGHHKASYTQNKVTAGQHYDCIMRVLTHWDESEQYESAQCLSEMFYLCVVHLYEFMCGNDSDECVRLKVQNWGHATVFKNWTSHIHLPYGGYIPGDM